MYTHPHRVVVSEDRFSVHGLPHHIVTTAHYRTVSRLSLSSAPVPSVPVCHCSAILNTDWKLAVASCALLPAATIKVYSWNNNYTTPSSSHRSTNNNNNTTTPSLSFTFLFGAE